VTSIPDSGTSYWVASTEAPEFPPVPGLPDVDVVVLGAGVAGVTTAYLLRSPPAVRTGCRPRRRRPRRRHPGRNVVVATRYPVFDRGLYFARLSVRRELVVAAPVDARAGGPDRIAPSAAGAYTVGRRLAAACRDPSGAVPTVSANCTHLRCVVACNDAEASWDCPCHGSCFAPDGTVLPGPATRPLQRLEIPQATGKDGGRPNE
jgi:nitrite reductase/ring-hydroxylating ferredoxin subunit